jgi:hypothetical protein
MKEPFHDDYQSEKLDPLDGHGAVEFDWQQVSTLLDEAEPNEVERDYDALAIALKRILLWLIKGDLRQPHCELVIARRVIALAWSIDPAYFKATPSLSQVARHLGMSVQKLSRYTADVRRQFGIRNRLQAHAWNFNGLRRGRTRVGKNGR